MCSDPLWGVGCGFALQSAEWLVDGTGDAMAGRGDLDGALRRYARVHRRKLTGHHVLTSDYATGRRFKPIERLLFSAAARDTRLANHMEAYGTRQIGPARFLAPPMLVRAAAVNVRHRREAARA
jgi:hypothetical protein